MIRPITCVTFLLACGSGLYLYQVKHRVHLLDQQIVDVVHQTEQIGQQERVLRAQWALLDQPDRLQQLASQFLTLQPTKQSQYATAADLGSRLPPIEQPPVAAPPADGAAPADGTTPATAAQAIASLSAPAAMPPDPVAKTPAKPADAAVASAAHVGDHPHVAVVASNDARPHAPSHSPVHVVSEQVPAERPAAPRAQQAVVRRELPPPRPRPYVAPHAYMAYRAPRPLPRYAAPVMPVAASRYGYGPQPASAGYGGGSLLGMARDAAPPPPAPVPAGSWQNWNR
jgi:hypothetical protein